MSSGLKTIDGKEIETKEVDSILKNFDKGNYLGDFKIYFEAKAVNIKDFQKFRQQALRRFKGDDWRYLKYLIKMDDVMQSLFSLPKYQVKPNGDKPKEINNGN